MGSYPDEFPFGIMEVVNLLNLRIRRQQANSVYVDCPFCGDRRGRMNVNFVKNVWRCNYCDAHGGMLALYAELNHTTTSDAYWEIAEALCDNIQEEHARSGNEAQQRPASPSPSTSGAWAAPAGHSSSERKTVPQSNKASPAEIHQTLSLLLAQLTLRPAHREHLRSPKRGLSDEQIDALGFKSTPPPFLCRSITERLIKQGCKVQGVPGFYQDNGGHWTMAFYQKTAGILIPAIGFDGMLQGFQIKLDIPLKNKDDPPEKPGAKYIWFSSSSKKGGTGSGSPVHLAGNPSARVVYVIEGLLKADISHCLTGRTFAAIAGANNTSPLDAMFALLAQSGTEEIKINGGFWGWEPIETLERLYPLFEQYTLDPIYEWYGNFVNRKPEWQRSEERQAYQGCTVISGRFLHYGNFFYIVTDEEELIQRFERLVADNKATQAYQDERKVCFPCSECNQWSAASGLCGLTGRYRQPQWECFARYVLPKGKVEGDGANMRIELPIPEKAGKKAVLIGRGQWEV